jgi:DNA polymerase-1
MKTDDGVLSTTYSTNESHKPTVLWFDIETDGLEATVIHCLVTLDEDGNLRRYNHAEDGNLREGLKTLEDADLLIGHNIIGFDMQVIHRLYPGWHTKACVRDTLVCSRLAWPHLRDLDFKRKNFPRELIGSHSLKAWGIRLGYEKYAYAEQDNAFEGWTKDLEDYCARDVEITHRLFRSFLEESIPDSAVELEHEIHDICELMTVKGIYFNREEGEKLYARLLAKKDQLEMELQTLFPPRRVELKTKVKEVPFNPGSRLQIAERFRDKGWTPKEFTSEGRPAINEGVLTELAKTYPEAASLNQYLLIQKRIGQLAEGPNSWLGLCDEDNRIHARVISCGGTISHRMAHHSPNIGQVPNAHAAFGTECRSLFCVPEGSVMVGTDLSSIELRMLAHLMAYWDNGRYAQEVANGDPHQATADAVGVSRPQGKTINFAMIYGAGDQKLGEAVGGTRADGKALRRKFYDRNPAFRKILEEIQLRVKSDGRVLGLDGRPLYPRSQHSSLNLWIQNAAVTVAKRATLLHFFFLEMNGIQHGIDFHLAAHVHDEWQVEIFEEHAETAASLALDAIKRAGEYYDLKVPLDGETKTGRNWADTH